MRYLKGGEEIPLFTIAILLLVAFVGLILVSPFFLDARITANLGVEKEKIQVVDLAHLAEKCFSEDGPVKESFLTDLNFQRCGFVTDVLVSFVDIETKEKWSFGKEGVRQHNISVSLERSNGEIHVGELHVEL